MRYSFHGLLLTEQSTGIRTLITGLLAGLSTLPGCDEWIVYVRPGMEQGLNLPRWASCRYVELPLARSLPGRIFCELFLLPGLDDRYRVDVSYSPVTYLPVRQRIPAVVTFVDFSSIRVPAGHTILRRLSHRLRFHHALFHAGAIATLSATMRRDLLAAYGERISCPSAPISCGVGPEFFEIGLETAVTRKEDPDTSQGLLLASGGTDARKDIRTLALAFAELPDRLAESMTVEVLGPEDLRKATEILQLIPENRRRRFRFRGFLPGSEVLTLFSRCKVFVFPTLDEGFGLPVLEAMSSGRPVICSDLDVLREVAADCARYFPAGNHCRLAERIEELWNDPAACRRRGLAGRERARSFSWPMAAERLMGLLRQAQASG